MLSQATTQYRHGKLLVLATVCALANCVSGNIAVAPKRMVVTPLQDAKFVPNDPRERNGPQLAVLWGRSGAGTVNHVGESQEERVSPSLSHCGLPPRGDRGNDEALGRR